MANLEPRASLKHSRRSGQVFRGPLGPIERTQVNQFRHAIADEHAVRVRVGRAALGVRRGDRIARRGQALLVRVRIGAAHVVGDRALQVFRRTETERARIVLDYVAGMTDRYAMAEWDRLCAGR